MNYSVPRGSKDYVYSTLKDRYGKDLSLATLQIAVHRGPVGTSWIPAVWDAGKVRSTNPITFSMPLGIYDVTVRLADNPEEPFVRVGKITITN